MSNYYAYHTEDEKELELLDKEFNVVTVVGGPSDGVSPGWDLAIFDSRSKDSIQKEIAKIFNRSGHIA